MQFISNHPKPNHQKHIIDLIESADEMYLATAFLKSSGLSKILPAIKRALNAGKKVTVIAGQNFALTEPAALWELRRILKSQSGCGLYIAHAIKPSEVFHPKFFLFRSARSYYLMIGSANITEGGLSSNVECSLLISGNVGDQCWKDALGFYNRLLSPENSEKATLLAIKRYESFYEKQRKHNLKSKAIPDRKKGQMDFNYFKLREHFRNYNTTKRQRNYRDRVWQYEQAKAVLDQIADSPRFTQADFEPLLDELVGKAGENGWWHSGSLIRLRRSVYPYYQEFRQIVRFIRGNKHRSPSGVFTRAKEMVNEIEGASVNYITEIMMTYNPQRFANLNKNPLTVLRIEGDVHIKATAESFSGDDYEEYCELVSEICREIGLHDMLEADSFFNTIYWPLKKKK